MVLIKRYYNKMLSMKKIVHITSDSGLGGGQTHLIDVIKHLDRSKFTVVVICDRTGAYVNDFKRYSDNCYQINFKSHLLSIMYSIFKILVKESPDIVHSHLLRACIIGTISAYFARTKKIYSNLHGTVGDDKSVSNLKYWAYVGLLRRMQWLGSQFIAVSEDMKQKLIAQGIDGGKIFVIYNGVDANRFKYSTKEDIEIPIKLVFVGRLALQKGVVYLIEALKALNPAHFTLTIVGDGILSDEVKAKVVAYELSNVTFLGFIKDVQPILSEHDVFVAPSLWEGLPISFIEAMSMSMPVIATTVGGIPELIIDGKGGYLCEPANPKALADAITKLVNEPEQLIAFGKFNRQRVEEYFTVEKCINEIEALYA